MTDKQPCSECGRLALPRTLEETGGLCMRCFKKKEALQRSQVFISYRRTDEAVTQRIVEHLDTALPWMKFFLDTAKLESGRQWSDALFAGLSRSNALLVIIGPEWQSSFRPRHDETDVMRREIEWGITEGRALLPVLINGATMPRRNRVPESIRPLLDIEAVTVDRKSFEADVAAIAERLPSLVTEYRRNYGSAVVGSEAGSFDDPRPDSLAGRWETRVGLPNGQELRIGFVVKTESLAVSGWILYPGERRKREFSADWALKIQERPGSTEAVPAALVLNGFIPGRGPFNVEIPILEKRGEAYVGVNSEGWNFWSRHLEGGW